MSEILKTIVDVSDCSKDIAFAPASGSDFFIADNADHRMSLIVHNTNATQNATITVKAGNGLLASKGDASVTVGPGKITVAPLGRLESARVKVLTGDDKGKVFVSSAVDSGGSLANVLFGVISLA